MDIKYILTTAGAAKVKRYYKHIFGVTAIFRASSQSPSFIFELKKYLLVGASGMLLRIKGASF